MKSYWWLLLHKLTLPFLIFLIIITGSARISYELLRPTSEDHTEEGLVLADQDNKSILEKANRHTINTELLLSRVLKSRDLEWGVSSQWEGNDKVVSQFL